MTPLPLRQPVDTLAALRHPRQQHTVGLVTELLERLRSLRTDEEYYEFQRRLFAYVKDAEEIQWNAKRQSERERMGKVTDPLPFGSWSNELLVADRNVRQLKAVGDALAWRRFRFQRLPIIALSRDEGGGPIVGKDGLPAELGAIVDIWTSKRRFALLNGLTNCIRAADLTEFDHDAITLHEIKKNPKHASSRQRRRLEEIARAVNERAILPTPLGPLQLWNVSTQLRTRISSDLARAINAAQADRVAVVNVGKGWVIHCVSEGDWSDPSRSTEEVVEQLMRHSASAIAAAMGAEDRIQMLSADEAGRSRNLAPFTIYPLPPATCAMLTCDYLVFQSIISTSRIRNALELAGFQQVEALDASKTLIDGDQKLLRARYRDRQVDIHSTTVRQILLEFVDPRLYAKALREAMNLPGEMNLAQSISFSNERAAWK